MCRTTRSQQQGVKLAVQRECYTASASATGDDDRNMMCALLQVNRKSAAAHGYITSAALLGVAAVQPHLSAQVAAPGIPRGVPAQLVVHLHGALQHDNSNTAAASAAAPVADSSRSVWV
jgi:hypothetical protein